MIYHVSINGADHNPGTAEAPFRTINHAAQVAAPGDTVQVHEGIYREWVSPRNGGRSAYERITYEAAPGEHPVIKGSEVVTGWEKVEGTVWKVTVPNSLFGGWNPYAIKLGGDWFQAPLEYDLHLGDVYMDGASMFEASSREDLFEASVRLTHNQEDMLVDRPERSIYRWMAEVAPETTTVYGNFHEIDPNEIPTEINVRPCCFYPKQIGVNYITLRGFEIAQAACPFVPPTADQLGMVGPHWSLGWIIENNHMHDAKCCAVSLGKDGSTGDNDYTRFPPRMHSHYYQTEAVFRSLQAGWAKGKIGSHVVRNNHIHDCGQCGIVGHMGCAFSRIEHNHIHHVSTKREFNGAELAGIKLHAAIDVVIDNNNIHDSLGGIWLDWEAQGTRFTRNITYNTNRDFFIEVSHGPCLVDNNLLLSPNDILNHAQGTAFVHNIMNGNVYQLTGLRRQLPYHFAHSTQVLGIAPTYGGDDRFYNNILLGQPTTSDRYKPIQEVYSAYPPREEYDSRVARIGFDFDGAKLPVFFEGNAYGGVTKAYRTEQSAPRIDGAAAAIEERDGVWYLSVDLPCDLPAVEPVTTPRLGLTFFGVQPYENPDGTPVDFTRDLCGEHRTSTVVAGPLVSLQKGKQVVEVWRA